VGESADPSRSDRGEGGVMGVRLLILVGTVVLKVSFGLLARVFRRSESVR
jgi:hypothetical protein